MLSRRFVAVIIGAAFLTACGGGDGQEDEATEVTSAPTESEPETAAPTATEEPEVEAASRCEVVSTEMLDAIATGLTVDGGGTLRSGAAVRSDDFEELYFIAAEIDGSGIEGDGDVGVWASNSLEPGGGLIMAVDGLAKEFSEWPAGDSTSANIRSSDDGAVEARTCAG